MSPKRLRLASFFWQRALACLLAGTSCPRVAHKSLLLLFMLRSLSYGGWVFFWTNTKHWFQQLHCGVVFNTFTAALSLEHDSRRRLRNPLIVRNVRIASVLVVDVANFAALYCDTVPYLWWSWFPTTGHRCGEALQSLWRSHTSHFSTTKLSVWLCHGLLYLLCYKHVACRLLSLSFVLFSTLLPTYFYINLLGFVAIRLVYSLEYNQY